MTRLEATTVDVVRGTWARRLRVTPPALAAAEPVLIERPDLTAVVVLRLDETVAVAAPERALSLLKGVPRARLLDVATLLAVLEPVEPSLLGAATLSFADRRTLAPVGALDVEAAGTDDVQAVATRCSVEERDESGLLAMSSRWTARDRQGQPAAAAGYEVWGGALAHLGVAVAAGARRRGLGSAVACVAASHALDAGLVPQWRCRVDNVASGRAAARLGFVHVGDQVAVDLA